MMEDIVLKLRELLDNKIILLNNKLKEIENNNLKDSYDMINKFKLLYINTGEIDLELLSSFYDELIEYDVESLDDYRGYNEIITLAKDKKFNNNFDNIASSFIIKLNVLIEKCNLLLNKKMKLYGRIGYEKKKIEDAIGEYEKIGSLLEKISFSRMLSEEEYLIVVDYLMSEDLDEELKEYFVRELTIQNSKLMEIKVNKVLDDRRRQQERQIVERQRLLEEEIKEEKDRKLVINEDSISSIVSDENIEEKRNLEDMLGKLLDDSQLIIYNKAKNIILSNINVDEDVCNIVSLCNDDDRSLEDRLAYYNAFSDKEKKMCIYFDLKNYLINDFENNILNNNFDENLFNMIEMFVSSYENIEYREKLIEEANSYGYFDLLNELGMYDKVKELEDFYSIYNEVKNACSGDKAINDLYSNYIAEFINKESEFIEFVKNYYINRNSENLELLELSFEELIDKINAIKILYNELQFLKDDSKVDLLKIGCDLYSLNVGAIKNIISFLGDDDRVVSVIEEDIINDRRLNAQNNKLGSNFNKIVSYIGEDFVAKNGQSRSNKVKTSLYSKKFLEEFQPKEDKNGFSRIFYTRFNVHISDIFPELGDDVHLMFILNVGYGNTDGSVKAQINYDALDRCYTDRNKIREILSIFNADRSSMSSEEREKNIKFICEYLKRQCIKLGHFSNSCEMERVKKLGGGK